MKRFFMDRLDDWLRETNRKPLVLSGARQVGKTWLLKEFGRTRSLPLFAIGNLPDIAAKSVE